MKSKIVVAALFCGSIALTSACMSDEANRYYGQITYPPKSVEEVEVLQHEPSRPFVVIADFQARNATVKHMRKRAAEIGADAVIVVPVGGRYSEAEVWADTDRYATTYTRLLGTAIRYR